MSAKILVVDDDPTIVQMLKAGLEDEGYAVIEGFDGAMALQLAIARRPDLLIMDVNMPMTSGLRALEFMRQNSQTTEIPVLFLTGAASSTVYPSVENDSRVTFIKKPVDLEELFSLVRQLLANPRKS